MNCADKHKCVKTVVAPGYECLSEFVRRVPEWNFDVESVIRDSRNVVVIAKAEGMELVIKRYKVPTAFNRAVYSFLRPSKARRAYDYAFRLKRMGVETAEPVAYIEVRRGGLFHTGYFISRALSDPLMASLDSCDMDTQRMVLSAFARFTVSLHEKGVADYDYNPGNIFFRHDGDTYRFALIDINRMRFRRGRLRRKERVKVLRTLEMSPVRLTYVVEQYALIMGWNPKIFCGEVFMAQGVNLKVRIRGILKAALRAVKRLFSGRGG